MTNNLLYGFRDIVKIPYSEAWMTSEIIFEYLSSPPQINSLKILGYTKQLRPWYSNNKNNDITNTTN